jgi:nucleotide-binding universal stress UspA family protein
MVMGILTYCWCAMLNIQRILLPVDFPNASLRLVHQAATLAHHFHSEIVMLHVVTAQGHAAGVPEGSPQFAGWDSLAEMVRGAEKNLGHSLGPEHEGLAIRFVLVKGEPARAIVETAQAEKADLIMMPSHGYTFNQFLLGSVTAKVLHRTECPIWTGAHVEEPEGLPTPNNPLFLFGGVGIRDKQLAQADGEEVKQQGVQEFAIHNVLCAVDFGPRSHNTAWWAAQIAAEFGARLTLAHVTASVELWGPGGSYVNQKWKEELVSDASQRIANLQQEVGIKANVLIGSGDGAKVLSQAAKQTKADLLVTACYPYGGNLRIHGYSIICAVPIPVMSV